MAKKNQKSNSLLNLFKKRRHRGRRIRKNAKAKLTCLGKIWGRERKKRWNDLMPAKGTKGKKVCFYKHVCFCVCACVCVHAPGEECGKRETRSINEREGCCKGND